MAEDVLPHNAALDMETRYLEKSKMIRYIVGIYIG